MIVLNSRSYQLGDKTPLVRVADFRVEDFNTLLLEYADRLLVRFRRGSDENEILWAFEQSFLPDDFVQAEKSLIFGVHFDVYSRIKVEHFSVLFVVFQGLKAAQSLSVVTTKNYWVIPILDCVKCSHFQHMRVLHDCEHVVIKGLLQVDFLGLKHCHLVLEP